MTGRRQNPPSLPGTSHEKSSASVPLALSLIGIAAGAWWWSQRQEPAIESRTAARLRIGHAGGQQA
ncbi:hypothetical protein [Blastomonas aquatica]|uniref:hypothetical protein n=1 Tax=Blastomonas aquatica TaxID=1510276 RepID=UPI001664B5A2|nr:hypothetical protein [Blastomonas aquatica]